MTDHDFHAAGSSGVVEGVRDFDGVLVYMGLDVAVAAGDGKAALVGDILTGVSIEAETDCVAHAVRRRHNTKFKKRFIMHSIRTKS